MSNYNTSAQRIEHSIPMGIPVIIVEEYEGERKETELIVTSKTYFSPYSFSLRCHDLNGELCIKWVRTKMEDKPTVIGFRYA